MTPLVTVLIPTHDHDRLLPYAIASAQRQSVSEIEIFVVGDGASPVAREAAEAIARSDPRVRYFDFPKGERHGERNRHIALQEARGRFVAYLGDDDLWLPDHLDNLIGGMEEADFAHTLHTAVRPDGSFYTIVADIAERRFTDMMLDTKLNYFGPTVVGHRLSAYRRLPEGWRPAPTDIWTDLHMWRQFLVQPWIKARSIAVCDTLHFPSSIRGDMAEDEREREMDTAARRLAAPDGEAWYRREATAGLARATLEIDATRAGLAAHVSNLESELSAAAANAAAAAEASRIAKEKDEARARKWKTRAKANRRETALSRMFIRARRRHRNRGHSAGRRKAVQ
ncbi:MAG TPA: glycosyltransferase family 2 protein [Bauldia sp.]|nr:glycosyltransferase family 2 protein [Bauldia sp.]